MTLLTSPKVQIQAEPIDAAAAIADAASAGRNVGAVVTFSGVCRDEDGRLSALEIEHYAGMAEAEIDRIARQACERWPLMALHVFHRFGLIRPGETIVLVTAASSHREAAFEGASFLMDYLKTDAPFWKREHLTDGTVGNWVEAKDSDDRARERWGASPI